MGGMNPKKDVCPACKQKTGVDIVYGMPTDEDFEMAGRGEIALGGCCVGMEESERKCVQCGHEWRIKRRKTDHE